MGKYNKFCMDVSGENVCIKPEIEIFDYSPNWGCEPYGESVGVKNLRISCGWEFTPKWR